MKDSLESLSLFEFVCHSTNRKDFLSRINQICAVISLEFYLRSQDEIKFNFQVLKIVDDINSDVIKIIKMINSTPIIESQPQISKDLFIEIIKTHYSDFYEYYQYYKKIINN